MDDFMVIVCLPGWTGDNASDLDAALQEALTPYAAGTPVAPYRLPLGNDPHQYPHLEFLQRHGDLRATEALTWMDVRRAQLQACPYLLPWHDERIRVDATGNGYTLSQHNPRARWQQCHIGGAWHGHFHAANTRYDDPRIVRDHPAECYCDPRRCDGGPIGLLDFAIHRRHALSLAAQRRETWRAAARNLPPAQTWQQFSRYLPHGTDRSTRDTAWQQYRRQPRVLAADHILGGSKHRFDPLEVFDLDDTTFLTHATALAVPGSAHIDLDGVWHDGRSRLDGGTRFASLDAAVAYAARANTYLDSLDATTVAIAVHCAA